MIISLEISHQTKSVVSVNHGYVQRCYIVRVAFASQAPGPVLGGLTEKEITQGQLKINLVIDPSGQRGIRKPNSHSLGLSGARP